MSVISHIEQEGGKPGAVMRLQPLAVPSWLQWLLLAALLILAWGLPR